MCQNKTGLPTESDQESTVGIFSLALRQGEMHTPTHQSTLVILQEELAGC